VATLRGLSALGRLSALLGLSPALLWAGTLSRLRPGWLTLWRLRAGWLALWRLCAAPLRGRAALPLSFGVAPSTLTGRLATCPARFVLLIGSSLWLGLTRARRLLDIRPSVRFRLRVRCRRAIRARWRLSVRRVPVSGYVAGCIVVRFFSGLGIDCQRRPTRRTDPGRIRDFVPTFVAVHIPDMYHRC
jgi:hypothetical protein